jgi:hypothetical protein
MGGEFLFGICCFAKFGGFCVGKNSCGRHFSSAGSISTKSYSFGPQAN